MAFGGKIGEVGTDIERSEHLGAALDVLESTFFILRHLFNMGDLELAFEVYTTEHTDIVIQAA